MEQHYTFSSTILFALYGGTILLSLAASLYLLLRPNNAISSDITPPVRLRRWAAALLATIGISHMWWLFIYYGPLEVDIYNRTLLCTALDAGIIMPTIMCTMLVMLQDRRRPQWPVIILTVLVLASLLAIYVLGIRNTAFVALPTVVVLISFIIAMVYAIKQYKHWLLDNFADLQHKEVSATFILMTAFILIIIAYYFSNDYYFFQVFIEMVDILFIFILLWRVETLQTLTEPDVDDNSDATDDTGKASHRPDPIYTKLQSLLQQYCVDGQYYLKHDATLAQLARLIGTNTTYLSQHFAHQGLTYNAYINNLRIEHFEHLYREAVSKQLSPTATELAGQCGFRSYKAFSAAFKQNKGQTVSAWMRGNTIPILK